MKKQKIMPEEILVYLHDTLEDGTPVYCVANKVDEIPEDISGDKVGIYFLNRVAKFTVKRELA